MKTISKIKEINKKEVCYCEFGGCYATVENPCYCTCHRDGSEGCNGNTTFDKCDCKLPKGK